MAGRRALRILRAVKMKSETLTQVYERAKDSEGRWYAVSMDQLQSAPKAVRKAAIGTFGWECDLNNAYPTILANLVPQRPGKWRALREYALDKHALRRDVADGFGISMAEAKTLLLSVVFGRSITKWREARPGIVDPSPRGLIDFAREIAEARYVLTGGMGRNGESQLSALSRKVQAVESAIMTRIEGALYECGFDAGTLVHDAIIVQRRDGERCTGDDRVRIQSEVDKVLQEMSCTEGWHIPLGASVTRVGD